MKKIRLFFIAGLLLMGGTAVFGMRHTATFTENSSSIGKGELFVDAVKRVAEKQEEILKIYDIAAKF